MEDDIIFEVPEEDLKKLRAKYSLHIIEKDFYSTDITIIKINNHEIRIKPQIVEYWQKSKQWEKDSLMKEKPLEYIKNIFYNFFLYFKEFCNEYSFQYEFNDVFIVTDNDTLSRPIHDPFYFNDGIYRSLIYMPGIYFEYQPIYLFFTLLHEFCHCWIIKKISLCKQQTEILTDYIAICILANNAHEFGEWENHIDIIGKFSYLGKMIRSGKCPKDMLQRPLYYLKEELKNRENLPE